MLTPMRRPIWISLGGGCQVAYRLREAGLRNSPMPFDWIRTPIKSLTNILSDDFAKFLDECTFESGILRETYHHLTLIHDSALFQQDGLQAVRSKYAVRIQAYREALKSDRPIVFVRGRVGWGELIELRAVLAQLYPKKKIYLLGVHESGAVPGVTLKFTSEVGWVCGPAAPDWRGRELTWDKAVEACRSSWCLREVRSRPALPEEVAFAIRKIRRLVTEHAHLLTAIPPVLVDALIAAEDHRNAFHLGVDPIAVMRAVIGRLLGKSWGGGSTIEQQLYRTIAERREPTLLRKLREMCGAVALACTFSKVETAKVYLLIGYFGARMNGIRQATSRLGLDICRLTSEDAAKLVARLKYPDPLQPSLAHDERVERRAMYILMRMRTDAHQGKLSDTLQAHVPGEP